MCQIRMLVIIDSTVKHNIVKTVLKTCVSHGWDDVRVRSDLVDSNAGVLNPDVYDIAVMDAKTIATPNSKPVLGLGTPILHICDVDEQNKTYQSVIKQAVECSRLREKIANTTEHIQETFQMIAACLL